MTIYLMRHGFAERPVPGQEDATRCLTEQGRSDVARVAQALAEGQPGLEYLFSSPFLEATMGWRACVLQYMQTQSILKYSLTLVTGRP